MLCYKLQSKVGSKTVKKIYIPVKDHPEINFLGSFFSIVEIRRFLFLTLVY